MMLTATVQGPGSRTSLPDFEWDETACPLCAHQHTALLIEGPDCRANGTGLWFAIVQCQACGLCFTNPRPSVEAIDQFYPDSYEPHCTPSHRVRSWKRPARKFRWKGDLRKVLPWHGQRRLLDFGCGGGSFLARMFQQGWNVTGLDVSNRAVRRIRAELGLQVLRGTLPHADLRPASFDVITMWQSLEHVHAPLETVREAFRLLVPGGKLVVAVPNIDSLPFCWFRREWIGLDLPRHLTHFSPWTLTLMLQRAGFQVEPIRMLRHTGWVQASAELSHHRATPPAWISWLRLKPFARLAACYSAMSQQTDCMLALATKPILAYATSRSACARQ